MTEDDKEVLETYRKCKRTRKTKLDFSKKLAVTSIGIFIYGVLFASASWIVYRVIPTEILTATTAQLGVIGGGYLTKAGFENYRKIGADNSLEGSESI
jgi:hypothetical protein